MTTLKEPLFMNLCTPLGFGMNSPEETETAMLKFCIKTSDQVKRIAFVILMLAIQLVRRSLEAMVFSL